MSQQYSLAAIKQQQHDLSELITKVIAQAKQQADDVEVAINQSQAINVSTHLGETENIEFNNDIGLGITVYRGQRKGSASTNDLSPQALSRTIEAAINIMQYTNDDPYCGLGDKALMAFEAPDLQLFYADNLSVEQAIDLAKQAENSALAHPQITQSDGAYLSSGYAMHIYGNSYGMLNGYAASRHSLSCTVLAEQDGQMQRNYAFTTARRLQDLRSPEWVGQEAAQRTVAQLGARQIATTQAPVLFSAEVASSLFRHLASAISGGAVYRKATFLLDQLGQQILPDWLTIDEQPHLLGGLASAPFDSEGTRTEPRLIVQQGQLATWLLSNYSARKLNLRSTGHAGGIYNWLVSSNSGDLDTMLKQMDRGLLVTSLMGQGVNTITGGYSRGATGFWVENGQIQYPVNEVTIAGNLQQMMQQIVAIGSDIETRGTIQSGSVLIEQMSIAGK